MQTVDRAFYEKIKGLFPNQRVTASYLRQDIPLENNKDTYLFDFNENQKPLPAERKLSIKDAFASNMMGLYLCFEETAKSGRANLVTYPNSVDMALAYTPATLAQATDDLEAVYNGILKSQVDQDIIFDGLDTRRFRVVKTTQRSAINDFSEQNYNDGFERIEPNLVIYGHKNNQFTVKIPTWSGIILAANQAGWQTKIVLYMSGLHIPNGAGLAK